MKTIIESEKSIMNFMTAISTCFKKYATFSGRARRSEYWYFFLFTMVLSTALSLIFKTQTLPSTLFSLAVLVPSLAVSWRRMHDIGKAGAWSLIILIPVLGAIIFWIWCAKNSEEGANEYGENPKGE